MILCSPIEWPLRLLGLDAEAYEQFRDLWYPSIYLPIRCRGRSMTNVRAGFYSSLIATFVGILGLILTYFDNWKALVPGAQERAFGDLNIVTTTAGCVKQPMGNDVRGNPCSLWVYDLGAYPPEPYNYPSFWFRSLAFFEVTGENTHALGVALILLFALSIGLLAFLALGTMGSPTKAALLLGTACMPPGLLAMERGNTDIFVFAILVAGVLFLTRGNGWVSILAYSISGVVKIFPLGAVIALSQSGKDRFLKLGLAVFLTLLGISMYIPELSLIAERTPQATYPAFGSPVLPSIVSNHIFSTTLDSWVARALGFLVFALIATIGYFKLVKEPKSSEPHSKVKEIWKVAIVILREDFVARVLFLSGSGAFCFTYLLGTNFDYRGIFLYPVIFSLIRVAGKSRSLDFFTGSLLLSVSLFNFPWGFTFLADGLLLFLTPLLALAAFQISLLEVNK